MRTGSLALALTLFVVCLVACGSSSSSNKADAAGGAVGGGGAGGDGGGLGDLGGAGGNSGEPTGTGGAQGIGGGVGFMAIEPCAMASAYQSGATITFPNADMSYSPKCLTVSVGDSVTFTGDFMMHPLEAARRRGNTADNPITTTQGSMPSRLFTFANPGFFGYYCQVHGASDSGAGMAGVIWVQ